MACGCPGCGSQVRLFTARLSTIQALGPHLSHLPPCLTPSSLCSLIQGIMLVVKVTELSKVKEDLQDPGEARALWRCSSLGLRWGSCIPLGLLPHSLLLCPCGGLAPGSSEGDGG